jgi:hypothetical protein
MLNIKLKCQKEEFYPFVLNTCRNILQLDILIAPAGISSPSTATMIIMENNVVRNKVDRHFCELSVTPSRILSREPVEHFHSFENTEE